MADVRFYALQRRALDEALIERLEEGLSERARIVVQASGPEQVSALDERLWTFRDESFLAHGIVGAGDEARQPVLIGDGPENPNSASWRIFVGGADPQACFAESAWTRLIVMFDDRDEASKADARKQWAVAKAAGHGLSFWREADDGAWRKSG
jgi:DNA polymerase III subunit chi